MTVGFDAKACGDVGDAELGVAPRLGVRAKQNAQRLPGHHPPGSQPPVGIQVQRIQRGQPGVGRIRLAPSPLAPGGVTERHVHPNQDRAAEVVVSNRKGEIWPCRSESATTRACGSWHAPGRSCAQSWSMSCTALHSVASRPSTHTGRPDPHGGQIDSTPIVGRSIPPLHQHPASIVIGARTRAAPTPATIRKSTRCGRRAAVAPSLRRDL
jgi:hypothetical protein